VNKALLDTDIHSELGKGIILTVLRNATAYLQTYGFLTTSAISVKEIIQGYQRVGAVARLQIFRANITSLEVLPFDHADGDLAGRIAGDLDRTGQRIGHYDPLIAALAIRHGLDLVTGNDGHLQRLPPLGYPLTLVNWRV
jgi:tRNA(fMet)-specific endonuclease VapC